MALKTKVQCIKRKNSQQWYVNFPAQVAQMLDFQPGETLEWDVLNREQLLLNRPDCPPAPEVKKKRKPE